MALDAAEALALEGGMSAITARAVAAKIGYAPGTLYNLFENIDGLVLALNARTLAQLETRLEAETMQTGDVERDLSAVLNVYADEVEKRPKLWGLLTDHILPDSTEKPAWFTGQIDNLLTRLEKILLPVFPNRAPDEARREAAISARLLWVTVHGLLTAGLSGTLSAIGAGQGRELAHKLVTTYLHGLQR